MKNGICLPVCLLLSACATPEPPVIPNAAVEDFISIHGLQEVDLIRTSDSMSGVVSRQVNDYYMRYRIRQNYYLIEFVHRCPAMTGTVTTDVRSNNIVRARSDTIRGCRIARIFQMSGDIAAELRNLGKPPGSST